MNKLLLTILFLFTSALHAENFLSVEERDDNGDGLADYVLKSAKTYQVTLQDTDFDGTMDEKVTTEHIQDTSNGTKSTWYRRGKDGEFHYQFHIVSLRPHGPSKRYYKQDAQDGVELKRPTYLEKNAVSSSSPLHAEHFLSIKERDHNDDGLVDYVLKFARTYQVKLQDTDFDGTMDEKVTTEHIKKTSGGMKSTWYKRGKDGKFHYQFHIVSLRRHGPSKRYYKQDAQDGVELEHPTYLQQNTLNPSQ